MVVAAHCSSVARNVAGMLPVGKNAGMLPCLGKNETPASFSLPCRRRTSAAKTARPPPDSVPSDEVRAKCWRGASVKFWSAGHDGKTKGMIRPTIDRC